MKKSYLYVFIGILLLSNVHAAINETNALYDLSNISNSNDLYSFVKASNDLSGQTLMMAVLLAGFIILFASMKNYGNREALIASGFIIMVMTILFSIINFVPKWLAVGIVVAFLLLFSMMAVRKDF